MRQIHLCLVVAMIVVTRLGAQNSAYVEDLSFGVEQIGAAAKVLIEAKKLDWRKIGAEFEAEAKTIKTDGDHLRLLTRLLARLQDGHAEVRPLAKGKEVRWPDEGPAFTGSGLLLGRAKKGIFVRGAFATARDLGIEIGWEVVKVNGKKADVWLAQRVAEFRDLMSFSTDHQAEFFALQRGMVDREGASWEIEFKTPKGKKTTKTIRFEKKVRQVPEGPVVYPGDPKEVRASKAGNVRWAHSDKGFAYIHIRRSPGTVVEELDEALAALGVEAKGLILDYRNNTGGGFDHEAFMGRFIPEGHELKFNKRYQGAGPLRYGGNIVVIVDGTTVSAGETGSGIFKEDGRAYLIGESPTAGMSSQKKTIELPSGLFALYVSTHSNMGRFNDGRGIEGIGVIPHETIPLDAKDLAKNEDTLINRAEALLSKFPRKSVPYDPKDFGWR